MKPLPPLEWLRTRLKLDVETGRVYWRERSDNPQFTAQFAGRRAGTLTNNGYRGIYFNELKRRISEARIIWALAYGADPYPLQIDHINGKPSDNRLSNLRLATPRQNCANRRNYAGKPLTGTTPLRSGKFRAQIMVEGVKTNLGHFNTQEEARQVYERAHRAAAEGFHPTEVLKITPNIENQPSLEEGQEVLTRRQQRAEWHRQKAIRGIGSPSWARTSDLRINSQEQFVKKSAV